MKPAILHGLLAEFDRPETLILAVKKARREGFRKMDAYTPMAVREIAEELGTSHRWVAFFYLAGGIIGGLSGFFLQIWAAVWSYPIIVGGKPMNSWPSFIPITFELTVLGSGVIGTLGMLALNGLPRPYHPVFNVPSFGLASRDRFFLAIEATDPLFDREATRRFLLSLGPREVSDIAR
jgi:hypothetical protein